MKLIDGMGRVIDYLRLSVTDRCTQQCIYCLPQHGAGHFNRNEILSLDDLSYLTERFVTLFEINHVRVTGGEPLLLNNVEVLIHKIARMPGIHDLSLTTNGELLAGKARELAGAGLRRVNVSLDSLQAARYAAVTSGGNLSKVLDGIEAARDAGLTPIKINVVLLPEFDEETNFIEWAGRNSVLLRFLELMPQGGIDDRAICGDGPYEAAILARLTKRFSIEPHFDGSNDSGNHVRRYRISETGLIFEFISGVTAPFCDKCNRLRLDCRGFLRSCLYSDRTMDLRPLLGVSDSEFANAISDFVIKKTSRPLEHIAQGMYSIGG